MDGAVELPISLFDKVISRNRPTGVNITLGVLLLSSPFLAAMGDRGLGYTITLDSWRGLMIPPVVILYIFLVAPWMDRMGKRVLDSFRDIVCIDDEEFQNLINEAWSIPTYKELLAISIGGVIGFLSAQRSDAPTDSWIGFYWILSNILMYALLAWTIYVSIVSTRLTSSLLRKPLQIDPFDISPFEPIGRQSLLNALVFVGGISLSLVFVAWDLSSLMEPGFWLIYIPLGLVPVVVFFLNMLPTHRVLANAKESELTNVQEHFHQACRELIKLRESEKETGNLSIEINALAAYQAQLQMARTWPYNTAMLRTLFFSVLIPVGTLVGRIIVEAVAN
jgi:hypothetical protein